MLRVSLPSLVALRFDLAWPEEKGEKKGYGSLQDTELAHSLDRVVPL